MTHANETRENYNFEPPSQLIDYPKMGSSIGYEPEEFEENNAKKGAGWPTAETRPVEEDADTIVVNREQLVNALRNASQGDLIWVPGWVTIDLTGEHEIDVGAEDVTLASDRGAHSEGARLDVTDATYMRDRTVRRLFNITSDGFRATGFRLTGPQTTHNKWESYEINSPMSGLEINADYVEIDNIVGRGWGHTPVNFGRGGWIERPHLHHCDLVDNPQDALGYGVAVRHAHPLIQYNYFDNCRHAIAGSGHEDCSYIARYNLLGPRGILHAIDMHARESKDGSSHQAGKRLSVHHNEVLFTQNRVNGKPQEAIKLRDVPLEGAQILDNRFHHPRTRYSESKTGTHGSAILLDLEKRPATELPESLEEAGIQVRGNVSYDGPLEEGLGPAGYMTEDS